MSVCVNYLYMYYLRFGSWGGIVYVKDKNMGTFRVVSVEGAK